LPTIYPYREFAAAGGLISYGGNLTEPWYLAGVYAGRILKGEKVRASPTGGSAVRVFVFCRQIAGGIL